MFKGIRIDKNPDYRAELCSDLSEADLPVGEVTVRVRYSTLNYKDALAITGKGLIIRDFPMVPGIDFAGEVVSSDSERFKPGDEVILNGWGVGERHWGGLAEMARVPAQWLLHKPEGLSQRETMALGTAGYTAMLAVQRIVDHGVTAGDGEIVVSGANGGVGSFAIAILTKLGYDVTALTRRVNESAYLIDTLGAKVIMDSSEYGSKGKPLAKERWAAAVDSLGSHTLANICAATRYGGIVTACGLAQGMDFEGTVAPFILRGVTLAGIDSVMRPQADRIAAWQQLAETFGGSPLLNSISENISMQDVPAAAEDLLAGKIRGRVVVEI